MKTGDLVRFKFWADHDWKIGLLIKYEAWEKVGSVLFGGKVHRIRAENIQKAGRKDGIK